ncbi:MULTISPECIES: hypothetical protein [unclassified Bradyrhizobium]|uniref:hypothetical protein n=1 Tax=unclassified Bradyrhizobium TaxID=2631580 RepID=UPI001BAA3ED4|nr:MULTISPECIES: hypothetical protein [unclassified Bradyrhizobium]MBR1225301.1 hypothetical protein [Bradyrhizobium sp. AUGA SZCCT0176]MBR1299934.1 hypothetical protein [Bradyrhizobium sp. AUGA SZCCT0042]
MKKTPSRRRGFGIGLAVDLSRASISGPRVGTFFRRQSGARIRDHVLMMMAQRRAVNPRTLDDVCFTGEEKIWRRRRFSSNHLQTKRSGEEKKPGPKEPGLRYWPREADTITFQEGLLSARATGGGGHMRDTIAQRLSTMIPICGLRKPVKPHV